jgi:hypothetical protein
MKRRGFLASLTGAALAGPAAAKQAVTAASKSTTGGIARLGAGVFDGEQKESMCGIAGGKSDHRAWVLKRINECKRVLSGELTDEEIEKRNVDGTLRLAAFEIETSGLRSMAESSKLMRMARQDQRLRRERDKFYAKRNLNDYLKELAGLE